MLQEEFSQLALASSTSLVAVTHYHLVSTSRFELRMLLADFNRKIQVLFYGHSSQLFVSKRVPPPPPLLICPFKC